MFFKGLFKGLYSMETIIPYEVLYFFKVYVFEEILISNALYQKHIANKTFMLFYTLVPQFN